MLRIRFIFIWIWPKIDKNNKKYNTRNYDFFCRYLLVVYPRVLNKKVIYKKTILYSCNFYLHVNFPPYFATRIRFMKRIRIRNTAYKYYLLGNI